MSNKISEQAPQAPQPSGGAIDKVRKQARQLAYDVRYKVKGMFKDGQKTNPSALLQAYMKQLAASSAPGPVKACLLYTSPSPRDQRGSRMPSSA